MAQTILFATNRTQTGPVQDGIPQFGDEPTAAGTPLSCAAATVDGIDTQDEDSGKIVAVTPLQAGAFAEEDLKGLLESPNDVLVFIHGTMNDFSAAITRAAYNQAWLGETAVNGSARSYDVIAFTWPGRDYDIPSLFQIGDAIEGYRHDQSSAAHSNEDMAAFFRLLYTLKARIGTRRLNLLCHSMGCYALGGAMETLFKDPGAPTKLLFDEVMLAAGDEDCSTFIEPHGGRLSNLHLLGREITVYFNRNDIAMHLSRIVNGAFHLGYDGPPNRADLRTFPPKVYEFVNCIALSDYIDTPQHPEQVDRSHQYYRQSPTVRRDIAAGLAGLVPVRPYFYQHENFYAFARVDLSGQI